MPAKRKITIKRKPKVEEVIKEEVIEEETPVTTVVENEISDDELPAGTVFSSEKEVFIRKPKKVKDRVLGDVGGSKITKPVGRIRFEAQVWPYPMFMVPAEIRNYLTKKGLTTDVWKKDKEWLEKHNVDLEMVEKLKQFLQSKM